MVLLKGREMVFKEFENERFSKHKEWEHSSDLNANWYRYYRQYIIK